LSWIRRRVRSASSGFDLPNLLVSIMMTAPCGWLIEQGRTRSLLGAKLGAKRDDQRRTAPDSDGTKALLDGHERTSANVVGDVHTVAVELDEA
jgi:hypothetical protein